MSLCPRTQRHEIPSKTDTRISCPRVPCRDFRPWWAVAYKQCLLPYSTSVAYISQSLIFITRAALLSQGRHLGHRGGKFPSPPLLVGSSGSRGSGGVAAPPLGWQVAAPVNNMPPLWSMVGKHEDMHQNVRIQK